jgi:hypothetical protein
MDSYSKQEEHMHRLGLGIFILTLGCGLTQAQAEKPIMVGAHTGLLVPSLSRIQDSDALSDWKYDLGWGLDVSLEAIKQFSISAQYDLFPIRYHGQADRTDVRQGSISGRYGLLQHASGEVLYSYAALDSAKTFLFAGGSVDYFYVKQTVNGSYVTDNEETLYTNTASIDKVAFGIPAGIHSYVNPKLKFSFQLKPIFYYWNNESKMQFVTLIASLYLGYSF